MVNHFNDLYYIELSIKQRFSLFLFPKVERELRFFLLSPSKGHHSTSYVALFLSHLYRTLTYRVLTRLSSFNLVNFIIRDQGASWRDSA